MSSLNIIEHQGIVEEVGKSNIRIKVQVDDACCSCKVKGACSLSGSKDKIFEVSNQGTKYCVGEKVQLSIKKTAGYKALLISYVFPLILIILSLFIVSIYVKNEAYIIIICLTITFFYYFIIYLLRNFISKSITIFLTKQTVK